MTVRFAAGVSALLLGAGVLAACGGSSSDTQSSSTSTTKARPTGTTGSNKPIPRNDVKVMQVELLQLGCQPGPIDGQLGPDTTGAVRSFQAAAGLTVDGVVGSRTRAALTSASQTGSPKCSSNPTPTTQPSTTTTTPAPTVDLCTTEYLQGKVPYIPGEWSGSTPQFGVLTCGGPIAAGQYFATSNIRYCLGQACDQGYQLINYLWVYTGTPSVELAWTLADKSVYCDAGTLPQEVSLWACT
jgi:peptidoglycan hydrolase-like protein with peptidoglycan-binding domain